MYDNEPFNVNNNSSLKGMFIYYRIINVIFLINFSLHLPRSSFSLPRPSSSTKLKKKPWGENKTSSFRLLSSPFSLSLSSNRKLDNPIQKGKPIRRSFVYAVIAYLQLSQGQLSISEANERTHASHFRIRQTTHIYPHVGIHLGWGVGFESQNQLSNYRALELNER